MKQQITECTNESQNMDWNDKFLPGFDKDGNLVNRTIATKYWHIKCKMCGKYIPEYRIHYPKELLLKS